MAFQNSILAGDTLIRRAIQSANYEQGVSGWRIARDGSAELQQATVRGPWRVENSTSIPSYLEGGIAGNIPYLKWNGSGTSFIAEKFSENNLVIGAEPVSGNSALLNFLPTRAIFSVGDTKKAVIFDAVDGFLHAGEYFPLVTETWTTIAPASGHAGLVEYKLLPTGEVIFRGSVGGGTNVLGTQLVAVMPIGYRPTGSVRFHAPVGGNSPATGHVQMSSGGSLVISNANSTSSYWLNNVRYSVI